MTHSKTQLLCIFPLMLLSLSAQAADFEYSISRYSSKLDQLIDPSSEVEVLAEGMQWSEGPVWIAADNSVSHELGYLLFSDVPQNKILRWDEGNGLSIFLQPSGFEGDDSSAFREPGTNGLLRFDKHNILAANHGQRQLSLINLETKEKSPVVTHFDNKAFSSPNDLVRSIQGDIYFTDPPYGLAGVNSSPLKEIAFNGVYRLGANGTVGLLDAALNYPNGIAVLPDGRTLLVANSDPEYPVWKRYSLNEQGEVLQSEIFFDASAAVAAGMPGMPDGMVIDEDGNVFATGPGGIYILASDAELLGKINLDRAAANATFGGASGNTLFITAGDLLLRIETLAKGL